VSSGSGGSNNSSKSNNNMSISESAKTAAAEARKSFDFSSGYVVHEAVITTEAGNNYSCVCVFPLDKYLEAFTDHLCMADHIADKALQLATDWNLLNGSPESVGTRTHLEKKFTLAEHSFKGGYWGQKQHRAQIQMAFNSWGFTELYNHVENPPAAQLFDLKVSHDDSSSSNDHH
jgi:hypothetical protein